MTKPNDDRDHREDLRALASRLRGLAFNYSRLNLPFKQSVLTELRSKLAGMGGTKLSVTLSERAAGGVGLPEPEGVLLGRDCGVTPRGTSNCYWDEGPPQGGNHRTVEIQPGHLDRGVGVIHDGLPGYDESVGSGLLHDLAITLEMF